MFEIVYIFLKWWKPLLGVTFLAGLIAAGYSMTMDNYYQSNTVFQPSNPGLFDRSIFNDDVSQPVHMFGGKQDVERILSIGQSASLQSWVIQKFDLMNRYEIKPTTDLANFKVAQQFQSNFSMQKDGQGEVHLSVLDKDPQIAADIANAMTDKIDSINMEMIFGKKRDQVRILEKEITKKDALILQLKASMDETMKSSPDDTTQINLMYKEIKSVVSDLADSRASFDQTSSIIGEKVSTLYRYENAVPALKKSSPVRSMLVIGAMAAAFILLFLTIILLEKFQEYKSELA